MKRHNGQAVLNCLKNDYFPKYGKPQRLLMDNATQFTSEKFIKELRQVGVQPSFLAIRHPSSNIVERIHKEINRFFRSLIKNKHTECATWVPIIQNCLNQTHHETTEYSPVQLHLNKEPQRFWEKYFNIKKSDTARELRVFLAAKRIRKKAELRSHKLRKKNTIKYRVGDIVLVKALNVSNTLIKQIAKFMSIYEGPYTIKKQIGPTTYLLTDLNTLTDRGIFNSVLL